MVGCGSGSRQGWKRLHEGGSHKQLGADEVACQTEISIEELQKETKKDIGDTLLVGCLLNYHRTERDVSLVAEALSHCSCSCGVQ